MSEPLHIQLMNDEIIRALVSSISYIVGAGVPGELAEFGTMSGRTATILAKFLTEIEGYWSISQSMHGIPHRTLHLFDSFEGLPAPTHERDINSTHVKANVWQKGMLQGISPLQLRQETEQFLSPDRIHIYEGFFVKTLPLIPASSQFALVHVDCDYYESTIQVLDHLFARRMLAEGAVLLFDDWNCNRADPGCGERKAWQDILAKYQVDYSDEGSYSSFGHKFIIHHIS